MNHANAVNPVAEASNEVQPLASTKPELPVLSDLELLLCGGGESGVCW
jgi:hypothetical protein